MSESPFFGLFSKQLKSKETEFCGLAGFDPFLWALWLLLSLRVFCFRHLILTKVFERVGSGLGLAA